MENEIRTLKKHQKEADIFKKQVAYCKQVETACKTKYTIVSLKKTRTCLPTHFLLTDNEQITQFTYTFTVIYVILIISTQTDAKICFCLSIAMMHGHHNFDGKQVLT